MTHRPQILSALLIGTALLTTACTSSTALNPQEEQIKADLAPSKYAPATRHMRDSIETQELFAQAAFWSNEYHINPGDLESAIKLSAAVRKLGNPGRAIEITQTTRALYPRDPYLLAEYAAALIASERSHDAIPVLNEGLALTPSYGRLWSLKGAALDQQERYVEARQHYERALRITPNDPNVMANIGLSYALAGDAVTAEGWLRRATSQPSASDSVKQNLILVLQLQGKTAEADRLAKLNRPKSKFPQLRPAFNPAPTAQQQAIPQASFSSQRLPPVRLQTGTAQGQNFTSASEAVRAIAAERSGNQVVKGQSTIVPNQQPAVQTAPNGYPQSFTQAPQAYGSIANPTNELARRSPNRRRR